MCIVFVPISLVLWHIAPSCVRGVCRVGRCACKAIPANVCTDPNELACVLLVRAARDCDFRA